MYSFVKPLFWMLLFINYQILQCQTLRVHQYADNTDSTVYNALHRIFDANAPISYITFIRQKATLDHIIPLEDGEGKNGSLVESNVNLSFTIRRGRDYTNNFGQSARLTIDYFSQLRIAKTKSSPILPPTNGFGLGVDWAIGDNFRDTKKYVKCDQNCDKWLLGKCCFDPRNFIEHMRTTTQPFKAVTFHFKIHHYSNGQAEGFYVNDSVRPTRHDYKSGDFSTNYLRFTLMRHVLWSKGQLLSYSLGYQREFGKPTGFLKFMPEMEKSYGKSRVLGYIQFRSRALHFRYKKKHSIDCGSEDCTTYYLRNLWDFRLQLRGSYITDDVSNWRTGAYDKPHRFGMHVIAQFNMTRNRTLGYLLHYYYGRDYLNIRFDNVVHSIQIGITLSFKKHRPFIEDYNIIGKK